MVFGEHHLRRVLLSYMSYYNGTRTHLSLNKDAPMSRAAETAGRILCRPILGGFHHQYTRIRFAIRKGQILIKSLRARHRTILHDFAAADWRPPPHVGWFQSAARRRPLAEG